MMQKGECTSDNWKTPRDFYDKLDAEFQFDFDPCPYSEGAPLFDGLAVPWGASSFVNPPYSRGLKDAFVRKAAAEAAAGKTCVCLLPVSTSTRLFHDVILPNARDIRFIKGRIRFEGFNTKGEYVANKVGMFDSMVIVFGPERDPNKPSVLPPEAVPVETDTPVPARLP